MTRAQVASVEHAVGTQVTDLFSAVVGGYDAQEEKPKTATQHAQEKKVETIGGVLADLDSGHYYGH